MTLEPERRFGLVVRDLGYCELPELHPTTGLLRLRFPAWRAVHSVLRLGILKWRDSVDRSADGHSVCARQRRRPGLAYLYRWADSGEIISVIMPRTNLREVRGEQEKSAVEMKISDYYSSLTTEEAKEL